MSHVFVWLVLVLIGLETGLRLAGLVYRPLLDSGHASPGHSQATLTILCLGDSNTYGVGAVDREHQSYPAQLQALCDAKWPAKVRVINEGVPGQNSSELTRRLEDHIARHHPDLLLVLIGLNNGWNFRDLQLAQPSKRTSLLVVLSSLKLCRLATLLVRQARAAAREHAYPPAFSTPADVIPSHQVAELPGNAQTHVERLHAQATAPITFNDLMTHGKEAVQRKEFTSALALFQRAHEQRPEDVWVHYWLGKSYEHLGRWQEALWDLEYASQLDPKALPQLFNDIAGVYNSMGDLGHALEAARTAVQLHPDDVYAHLRLGTIGTRLGYHDQAMRREAIQELETAFVLGHGDNFDVIVTHLNGCYDNKWQLFEALNRLFERTGFQLDPRRATALAQYKATCLREAASAYPGTAMGFERIARDLPMIASHARTQGIRFYLLTYLYEASVNRPIRSIALMEHFPLIDIDTAFGNDRRRNTNEWFAPDGEHPNAHGYGLMADIVFQRLIADGALRHDSH